MVEFEEKGGFAGGDGGGEGHAIVDVGEFVAEKAPLVSEHWT